MGRVEPRAFACGDRIAFRETLRKEGVRNGALGTIQRVDLEARRAFVRLDDGRSVSLGTRYSRVLEHRYVDERQEPGGDSDGAAADASAHQE